MRLNRVTVHAENCQSDLSASAAEVWRRFEAEIPGHPLVDTSVEFGPPWSDRIIGLAVCIIPSPDDAVAHIILSEELLAASPTGAEHVLSLLHESIHLQIMSAMMGRTQRVTALLRRMSHELHAKNSGL